VLFNSRLTDIYGVPSYEYPGLVKIISHVGPEEDTEREDLDALQPYISHVRDYVRQHLPRLDSTKPAILETCR
jgi:sarcosine oxidase/L-pipecolate oxidase